MDQLVPYLKVVFNFMGITDLTFLNVSPVQFADTYARKKAIADAKLKIEKLVELL